MGCRPTNIITGCCLVLKALAGKYEGRRLFRDAITIIESDAATYDAEHPGRVSSDISRNLELARNALSAGERPSMVLERLKAIHHEARRRRDQAGLSAATLAIIHFRSRQLGELGKPAQDAIEALLAERVSRK